jgi:hypothetical protein
MKVIEALFMGAVNDIKILFFLFSCERHEVSVSHVACNFFIETSRITTSHFLYGRERTKPTEISKKKELGIIRGSFQKFCTLYAFSLKINLFYKIHLQAFSVISIVLYQSGPTFGQVFYSCLDAFVFDASDYSLRRCLMR